MSASRDSLQTTRSVEFDNPTTRSVEFDNQTTRSGESLEMGNDRYSRATTRYSGIEVNPLYDGGRRKSSLTRFIRQDTEDRSPGIHKRHRSIRNFISFPSYGIDEADGTFITKSDFLHRWRQEPQKIAEPYNTDTEENVLHFLAREGKLDVLRDLCLEHRTGKTIYQALTARDKFGQTPMISAVSAAENRHEILNFLLSLVLDRPDDVALQEATILTTNRHNDTLFTLLMKNHEVFLETRQLFFQIFIDYYGRYGAQSEGFYRIIYQILQQNSGVINSKSISDMIRELHQICPEFFREEHKLFSYKSITTRSNILMELAKSAKDDALRELLVNRQTYGHVTHGVLQERNMEGQTLLAIIEVNRVNLGESLPLVLKKEYGCHRRDILKTEQCLARQLESSMSSCHIINELNDLENSNSFSKKFKIWSTLFCTWLTPTIGLTFGDIFFDSLLTVEYYHQYNNESFVESSKEKCEECKLDFNSSNFNTSKETIHCFESCFSSEARLGYTLTFLLLPILFYFTEFLTLTERYEVTTLRSKLCASVKEMNHNRWRPLALVASVCKFVGLFAVIFFVVVFWQPITALFKFYRDGIYETSSGNKRVDARIKKRRSDLTASRGELIEVNVESAFEPIIQGYIIFPNIIDIAGKLSNMFVYEDGKVEISLQFTTVETAQLFSIGTSMVSLAWCYSEYHSVRKNMLLDITVSPCSRVTMFFYMLMQITARLLAFQLFALYWGPGNLYPLVVFVLIHMFISAIVHTLFSEDLFYLKEGKYLKYLHNTMMNAFATIYFHNYLRMDEMPRSGQLSYYADSVEGSSSGREPNSCRDAQTPGLHVSTFIRQAAFDILYFSEFVVLLGFGFSSQIVQEGFLGRYTSTFVWLVTAMTILALMLKFFYYNVLHIWSNTIFTTTRIRSQPFRFMGRSEPPATIPTTANQVQSRFVEYVFISSNSWFLGSMKTFKTTILILPRRLIQMIQGQGKQLGGKILDPIDAAAAGGSVDALEKWKTTARNLLHWRKTIALLCFFPLILLGIVVPLVIIIVLVAALVLSMPLMLALLFYNLFGNCKNIIDTNVVDNDQYVDKDIEELPPEISSIENPIFSCDPTLTLRKIQDILDATEILDLSCKPEMSVEELENITVLLLSLNPRRYKMRELNLDDSRLTDEKLRTLAPLVVRFRTVKIGGKQDYGVKGLEELRLYMEQIKGPEALNLDSETDLVPLIKKDKIMLKRLEIRSTKSKIGVTDLTWVNEEVKDIEKEDEKSLVVNEIALMIPYLNSVILDGFLRESAVKPVSNMIGKYKENQLQPLWNRLNVVDHMEVLSLRDCDINDRIIMRCLIGFSNIRMLDLSGNHDITHVGWKCLSETLKMRRDKRRLSHLIFQNYKNVVDELTGEQLASMFSALQKLDLRANQLSDGAIAKFAQAFSDKEAEVLSLEKLDLTGCTLSQESVDKCLEINRRKASDIITFKAMEVRGDNTSQRRCGCFNCCFSCNCK